MQKKELSLNNPSKKKVYRALAAQSFQPQNDLGQFSFGRNNFGQGNSYFGKSVPQFQSFQIPSKNLSNQSNQSKNFSFTAPKPKSKIKSSKLVIKDNDNEDNEDEEDSEDDDKGATVFDGYKIGNTITPCLLGVKKMKQLVDSHLKKQVNKGSVDYICQKDFKFEGRIYDTHNDAAFTVTLMKPKKNSKKCLFEIMRTSGDSFVYGDFKSAFLNFLANQKAIKAKKSAFGGSTLGGGGLSFGSSLPALNFDDFDDLDIEDDEDDQKEKEFKLEDAKELIKDATAPDSFREERRNNVVLLLEAACEGGKAKVLKKVPKVALKLLSSVSKDVYDTFVVMKILEALLKLGNSGLSINNDYCKKSLKKLEKSWSLTQKIKFKARGITLSFAPSQQICRLCTACQRVKQ